LSQAADEGHRIAGEDQAQPSLTKPAKDYSARADQIVNGTVAMAAEKAAEDAELTEWAEDYSELVATTEVCEAVQETIYDDFTEQGVAIVSWVAEDGACKACLDNADASPLAISAMFPSGDHYPPSHPRCRCHLERDVVLH
jgi:uncharacterized membrane protein YcjF (UPF0283 family)